MKNYTRKQYMNDEISHRQYNAQFVNDKVKEKVLQYIGLKALLKSKDEHLNDIPMRKWDALGGFAFSLGTMTSRPASIQPIDYKLLKDMGDGVSPASLVCIYKEAGRQLIEENTGSTINLDK